MAELRRIVAAECHAWGLIVRDNVDDAGPPSSAVEQLHLLTGQFLDPEGGSQKATPVVLLVVRICSLKIAKTLLIRCGAQRNFAYTFALNSPQIYRLGFSTHFTELSLLLILQPIGWIIQKQIQMDRTKYNIQSRHN